MKTKEKGRMAKATSTLINKPNANSSTTKLLPQQSPSSSSSTRRPVVPNIAAAGRILAPKWAETKPTPSSLVPKQEMHSPTQNGLNNNNSGPYSNGSSTSTASANRSHGRRPGRPSNIITSDGVFSQGIGEERSGTRGKRKQFKSDETVVGQLDTPLQDGKALEGHKKPAKGVDKKPKKLEDDDDEEEEKPAGRNVYARVWETDEELDEEELDELTKGNFIADLKMGHLVPFVLPSVDEHQFRKLIRDDGEKGGTECHELDTKDLKLKAECLLTAGNQTSSEAGTSADLERRPNKFLRAADTIRGMANAERAEPSPLLLFQLPSGSITRIAECMAGHGPAGDGDNKLEEFKPATDQGQPRNCLEQLPAGTQIGKLQFLRSGRAVLNIGGHRMDISEAIPSSSFDTLMRIETGTSSSSSAARPSASSQLDSNALNGPGPSTSKLNAFNASSSHFHADPVPNCNRAHLLGPLPHQFVCSFDFARLLQEEEEEKRQERRRKVPKLMGDNEGEKGKGL